MDEPNLEPEPAAPGRRHWWRVLLGGLAIYAAGLGILAATGNPIIFPTVIMVGSFLVPVAYVVGIYERRHLQSVRMPAAGLAFFYGGVLGTLAAGLLEPMFVRRLDFLTAFEIGLIEEAVKMIGVLIIARRLRHDSELDGLVLGAAAGMGFAAFESVGYAFVSFLRSSGSLSAVVAVTLLRGVLSPVGHGTWTAILAAVLFRESAARRFRLDWPVVGTYLLVAGLHGLWDGLPGLLALVVASGPDIFLAQMIVGAAGLFILWRRWREAVRRAILRRRSEGAGG